LEAGWEGYEQGVRQRKRRNGWQTLAERVIPNREAYPEGEQQGIKEAVEVVKGHEGDHAARSLGLEQLS
jgi:hypothetical protein